MKSGRYACCPMKNAVCCADNIHCCAEGQTCDNDKGTCVSSEQRLVAPNKLIPTDSKEQAQNHTCPDKSVCAANTTCCEMSDKWYACCPIANAVCCADRLHCCAPGQECDNEYQTCKSKTTGSPLTPIKHSDKSDVKQQNSILKGNLEHLCPDGKSKCPDETTCCEMESGGYGCCPMPEAVCCPDKIHCCKHGQKCDEKGGACKGANNVTAPWKLKLAAQPVFEEENLFEEVEMGGDVIDDINGAILTLIDKKCPDKKSHCADNNTCCRNTKGAYDCCPVPDAICCADKIHCCPKGYECDIQKGDCTSLVSDRRVPRLSFKGKKDITCADNSTICPEDFTCCHLSKTEYGCCPLPKAVCCSDMSHCCPDGYTCDTKKASCAKGSTSVPWFDKVPGRKVHTLGDSRRLETVNSVVCPDKKSECPDGSTCCTLESGEYGCCPIPNAVCCQDHEHCCPSGFTCDVKAAKCVQGVTTIPWFSKLPATSLKRDMLSVKCAGSKASCPDKTTCCDLPAGGFGCCPIPEAVCCDDHKHCCPKGYVCDTKAGTCHNQDRTMAVPWLEKFAALEDNDKDTPCPGGKFKCPGKSTCCALPTGGFGCCPLPESSCCTDHKHCCPKGYKCDSRTATCSEGLSTIPWFTKSPAEPIVEVGDVQCPDMKSKCPDNTTCCQMKSGAWACCPLPKAVCCSDQIHCCPNGYTCDVAQGTCKMNQQEMRPVEKTLVEVVNDVICPGGKYTCPDSTTCCALSGGSYGCCPFPNAECCSDHEHCCPSGYTCDTAEGKCERESAVMPWFDKIQSAVVSVHKVVCPDQKSSCPDGTTCCQMASGAYGCCPMPNAVCCSDHLHCCPSGHTCDVAEGKCTAGLNEVAWFDKIPALQSVESVGDVKCPGEKASCPTGQTCCELPSGGYACCPLPKAVCCNDHVHCCPNGATCDVEHSRCTQGSLTTPWVEKTPAKSVEPESSVVCPDQKSTCPDGSTCCQLASGGYGCCPIPKAVCCNDHVHCCPNGYTCDVAQGTCTQGALTTPWMEKTPAKPLQNEVKDVVCPDQKSTCPEGSTCCQLVGGSYGCCPIPKAVCCNDHVHCCPNGYTCDVAQGTCTQGTLTTPWMEKTPAKPLQSEAVGASVVCPDKKSTCPSGSTCCELPSGSYGCCPIPNAVCCNDHVHCCPNGYTCDVAQGTCTQGAITTPWMEKTPAKPLQSEGKDVVCPDHKSTCPDGSTCCQMKSGQFGCCPIPKAVCCSDQVHCCPEGYSCSAGLCTKADYAQLEQDVVTCSDNKTTCPNDFTCCQMSKKGTIGCCPLPHAVCCEDNKHCCPSGSKCNLKAKTCDQLGSSIQVSYDDIVHPSKLPSRLFQKVGIVKCSDKSTCPDGTTCCEQIGGAYACCPHDDAVCCADKVHCCPKGYSCNKTKNGTSSCEKDSVSVSAHMYSRSRAKFPPIISIPWYTKVPGTPVKQGNTGDQQSSENQLKFEPLSTSQSSDNIKIPNTLSAILNSNTAQPVKARDSAVNKMMAYESDSVTCPGGQFDCPDRTTCCKMRTGQWGCCPMPHAVCCSDGLHCCPAGHTCDIQEQKCKAQSSVPLDLIELVANRKDVY